MGGREGGREERGCTRKEIKTERERNTGEREREREREGERLAAAQGEIRVRREEKERMAKKSVKLALNRKNFGVFSYGLKGSTRMSPVSKA